MAVKSRPDTSTSIAAGSRPMTAIPIDNLIQPTMLAETLFADQSRSRLMTLPKELRNQIYEFVFCDNSTYIHENIANKWTWKNDDSADIEDRYIFEPDRAFVPRPVRLDKTRPPSKDCILSCRQLYIEMKHMHTAAYRAYWSENRSFYVNSEVPLDMPATGDFTRIEEFILVMRHKYHLRIAFNGQKWDYWLLPADGRVNKHKQWNSQWYAAQRRVETTVAEIMASMFSTQSALNPRAGQGMTRVMIEAIARHAGLDLKILRLENYEVWLERHDRSAKLGLDPHAVQV